ncbi:V-type ATP synthase subunit A [Amycolatopsis acididurans]|uniref:V-type ATP synthase subunit A n=1 Tax=Amycolatopsis acididurans TaxID=2724524 RepID=UPI0028AC3D71|nr:V-type ATP synthase subunit A [Amycolatopsis acididurans]
MSGQDARVRRVSGPLVELDATTDVAMHDTVGLGPLRIPGEVVAIRDRVVTVQAYEYTGGLAPGDPAATGGAPLSARLGPGLLGHVFDGLLRPLSEAPAFLAPGGAAAGDVVSREFRPRVATGDDLGEGGVLGVLPGVGAIEHRLLAPPGVSGPVEYIVDSGTYAEDAVVARVAGTPVRLVEHWPVRTPRPYRARHDEVEPLHTGQRVLDLLFPVARGGSAAVPGGFGTGKTVLLQQLAKWCDADVIVYVGCGERGNEMAEVVAELFDLADPRTGGTLADRTVVIANTSNMPMMAREASVHTGMTVAEYFRDMGYHVVLIADSTSRWAEALREFGSRTGALPAEEGYPAELASALAAFYERAGAVETLGGGSGSVTVVGAVSPPGGDLTEPVTAHTERFVRCRWTLDRDLAYARHYPAVSWSGSFSRDAEAIAAWHARSGDPRWPSRRGRVTALLADADRLSALAELVGTAALPGHERMTLLGARLLREAVLQQSALSTQDAFCAEEKTAALTDAVLAVVDAAQAAVGAGAPAAVIEDIDFSPLVRAREEIGPRDAGGVRQGLETVLAGLRAAAP